MEIDGYWYKFLENGVMYTGWYKAVWSDGNYNWYYFDAKGREYRGWLKDGGKWYYFNSDEDDDDGWMYSDGWYSIGDYLYLFQKNGAMYTGWYKAVWDDGSYDWYYYDSDGKEHAGWLSYGGKWYYFSTEGDGWMYADDVYDIGGSNYAFGKNGAMLTGWQYFDKYECWAYFDSNGMGHNGWLKSGGAWYWCEDGVMHSDGIVKIGDKWAEFGTDGKWLGYVDAPV